MGRKRTPEDAAEKLADIQHHAIALARLLAHTAPDSPVVWKLIKDSRWIDVQMLDRERTDRCWYCLTHGVKSNLLQEDRKTGLTVCDRCRSAHELQGF